MTEKNLFGMCCLALGGLPMLAAAPRQPAEAGETPASPLRRPNLILIMTDQQRGDALGCAGNPAVLTPNLDSLAAEGHLFTSAYSSCPSSTPARAGLLTGMSPWRHGLLGYGNEAEKYPCEAPTLLKQMGYYTAGIGKMHWYPQWNRRKMDFLLIDESGRQDTPNFKSDYRKWFALQAPGVNPDLTGIEWNAHRGGTYKLPEELHPTTWTGQKAVELIRNYQLDKPLYLKVSFARPHSPYDPPQRIYDKYKDLPDPEAPALGDWMPEEWYSQTDTLRRQAAIGNFGADYAIRSKRHYYASITFVDEQIGRVIAALKEKGLYDNSLIIFIADHGDMQGDHLLWRKTYAYEGSSAIPFIVKLPASFEDAYAPGETLDYPVELRDILPTWLELGGGRQPEIMDGRSLLPLFRSRKAEWRKYIDLEHSFSYFKGNSWNALTDGHIKYIFFHQTGEEQLFDLDRDPKEEHNLVKEKKYRKTLETWRTRLAEHLAPRGENYVKDGKLQIRKGSVLYGRNFPRKANPGKGRSK